MAIMIDAFNQLRIKFIFKPQNEARHLLFKKETRQTKT